MPRYTVQAPDGRTVVLEGDAPPTDADLDEVFASLPAGAAPSKDGDLFAKASEALGSAAAPFSAIGQAQVGGTSAAALTAMRNAGQVMSRAGVVPALTGVPGVPSIGEAVKGLTGIDPRSALSAPFAAEAPRNAPEAVGKALALGVPAAVSGSLPAVAAGGAVSGALSGDSPLAAAVTSLGLGAAGKGISAGVKSLAGSELVKSAIRRIVNPTQKVMIQEARLGRDPAEVLLGEGIPAQATKSIATMFDWVKSRRDEVGQAISAALQAAPPGTKVNLDRLVLRETTKAVRQVEQGIRDIGRGARQQIIADIEGVRDGLLAAFPAKGPIAKIGGKRILGKVQPIPGGVQLDPVDALKVKKDIGAGLGWVKTGDKAKDFVEGVKKRIYSAIDNELKRVSPEIAGLNRRYTSLDRIQAALEAGRAQQLKAGLPTSLREVLKTGLVTRGVFGTARAQAPALGAGVRTGTAAGLAYEDEQ